MNTMSWQGVEGLGGLAQEAARARLLPANSPPGPLSWQERGNQQCETSAASPLLFPREGGWGMSLSQRRRDRKSGSMFLGKAGLG